MPNLTDEQRRGLAEFCGLFVYVDCIDEPFSSNAPSPTKPLYYVDKDERRICAVAWWQPSTNPAQADMVLRALVKGSKEGPVYCRIEMLLSDVEGSTPHCLIRCGIDGEGDWWPDAVCSAALEVMGQKKGGA